MALYTITICSKFKMEEEQPQSFASSSEQPQTDQPKQSKLPSDAKKI